MKGKLRNVLILFTIFVCCGVLGFTITKLDIIPMPFAFAFAWDSFVKIFNVQFLAIVGLILVIAIFATWGGKKK